MSQQYPFQCNIAQALNIIGDKWSLLILHGIMSGHQTYKEIYTAWKVRLPAICFPAA